MTYCSALWPASQNQGSLAYLVCECVIYMQVGVTSVFAIIVYFMVGYQALLSKFLVFWLVCCLFQLTSETLGLLCAIATRTSTTAIIYCSAILLVCQDLRQM